MTGISQVFHLSLVEKSSGLEILSLEMSRLLHHCWNSNPRPATNHEHTFLYPPAPYGGWPSCDDSTCDAGQLPIYYHSVRIVHASESFTCNMRHGMTILADIALMWLLNHYMCIYFPGSTLLIDMPHLFFQAYNDSGASVGWGFQIANLPQMLYCVLWQDSAIEAIIMHHGNALRKLEKGK